MKTVKSDSIKLSAAIITRNEEERLPDCLKSASFADEILVVDSGSTDGTIGLAKSYGARVLVEKWRGFSEQKQFAVDHCNHDWVLILDADERIPEETARTIAMEMARQESHTSAFSFRRKNYLHDRWIRHCGWWPDRTVRLVNRKEGRFDGRPVHERWITPGRVKGLDAAIEHRSFRHYSEMVAKMELYSNLASKELFEQNVRAGTMTPITHGLWMFFRTYLLEWGFLDGFNGFLISVMNAGGSFLKYAKLKELHLQGKSRVP
jgi:(heptosyl)LPS beta-1,4-glucosyltransferase